LFWHSTASSTRDPLKARGILSIACDRYHAPSCQNLAVMYGLGDTGVPKDMKLHEEYKKKTLDLVSQRNTALAQLNILPEKQQRQQGKINK
jgi:TPR repeat protein